MLDRIGAATRETLAAGDVVQERRILRMRLEQRATPIGSLGILAGLIERVQLAPELPADRFVGLARRRSERKDRGLGLFGERRPLHAGPGEDERSGGRIQALAVELERRPPPKHDVEL